MTEKKLPTESVSETSDGSCTCTCNKSDATKIKLPTASDPQVIRGKPCYNCKQAPVYYFDTTWGEGCGSNCSKEDPCEQCQEDRDFPHVVMHKNSMCSSNAEIHHKSKKEALAMWERNNKPKHLRSAK
ncbi:hypothetical protein LMH73_002515 [Vibrio splendidus]|nr:hypothetical protein [Vibrio splendidus]MCC4880456.1 hypothetical protein [Vibrio splendidus]